VRLIARTGWATGPPCGCLDVRFWRTAGFGRDGRADEAELVHMVATAAAIDDGRFCFVSRAEGRGRAMPERGCALESAGVMQAARGRCCPLGRAVRGGSAQALRAKGSAHHRGRTLLQALGRGTLICVGGDRRR